MNADAAFMLLEHLLDVIGNNLPVAVETVGPYKILQLKIPMHIDDPVFMQS